MVQYNRPEQKMAIEREYNSLMENGTWVLISYLNEANIIMKKWYFKL